MLIESYSLRISELHCWTKIDPDKSTKLYDLQLRTELLRQSMQHLRKGCCIDNSYKRGDLDTQSRCSNRIDIQSGTFRHKQSP